MKEILPRMKPVITATACLLFVCSTVFAQVQGGAPEFDKLFDLYTMDQVEDCAWKAMKMTENDKYAKNPEPYLYYAMCMLQIYEQGGEELEEDEEPEFPKPYKNMMKYAAKGRKKDKSGEICAQNEDFFTKLKEVGRKEAHWYIEEEEWKKAASQYKYVWKTDPDDAYFRFMQGTCEAISRNPGAARVTITESVKSIIAKHKDESFEANKESVPVLEEAMILYTDWLVENQQLPDSAKSLITRAKGWMPESTDIAKQYDKLHGN